MVDGPVDLIVVVIFVVLVDSVTLTVVVVEIAEVVIVAAVVVIAEVIVEAAVVGVAGVVTVTLVDVKTIGSVTTSVRAEMIPKISRTFFQTSKL